MAHSQGSSLLSILRVKLRYTYLRQGQIYYQRHVPKDLLDRFPQSIVKVPLGTSDPLKAVKAVQALNLKYERQWELLRADPTSSAAAAETGEPLTLAKGLGSAARTVEDARTSAMARQLSFSFMIFPDRTVDGWNRVMQSDPADFLRASEP